MQLQTGASTVVRHAAAARRAPRLSSLSRCSPSEPPRTTYLIPGVSIPHRKTLHHSARRRSSAWAAAVSVAGNVVTNAISRATKGDLPSVDPLRIVAKEMKFLTGNIRKLLGSGHPSLDRAAKYYTQAEGKHVRPLIVLLMSQATSLCPKTPQRQHSTTLQATAAIDSSISPLSILSDFNPSAGADNEPASTDRDILPSQRRLAEITELIHTASLLHDDVIDHSVSRRGSPSANLEFGNKMAVLAGDFLLGRASVALARLRHAEVVELLATVIANLVEGEFMQLKNTARDEANPRWSEDALTYYLQKTYLKTASLISKSCRAAALLGGSDAQTVDAAYSYGKNLGLAFQLVDDMLDYTRSERELGKPAGADLELGLATAPLLFAWKTMPELGALVGRKFAKDGDVTRARDLVMQSDGIKQTRALAEDYAEQAIAAIRPFPDSEAKNGLIEMAVKTLKRQK
ncbi:isoprenoid synthase domain-containing protein [Lasiosphaeria miniovina]|uniref:Isoprenoid synthase domain-containing protein n=1 Tax=Lasiosphaeria miniovina TaxID=1954250 RepID=A0AA40DV77_9PEZI|nr:isoprenoid synthase domain-containing protein [Lasiosphaeria miniovina]KAK0712983.1 isoprenoid synthase domain-containing protein [Lasiosphaeria miniovina]